MKALGVLVLIVSLCGCEMSSREHLAEARRHLAEAAYGEAITAAEDGLEGSPDGTTAWGLALVRLDAQARAGNGELAKGLLEELATAYPDRIPVTEYVAVAHQLRSAQQGAAAIEVLDLAMRRFPGDPVVEQMIAEIGASGGDPAELEMLRSLGYIE